MPVRMSPGAGRAPVNAFMRARVARCDFSDVAGTKRVPPLIDDPAWGVRQRAKVPRGDLAVTDARQLSSFAANRVDYLVDLAMRGDAMAMVAQTTRPRATARSSHITTQDVREGGA